MESFNKYIIKTKSIRHNLLEYKKIDSKSKICAIVKANGYGIGANNVVDAIDDLVDFYGVACFAEAEQLRAKTENNILVLNIVKRQVLPDCAKKNIAISISSLKDAKMIASCDFDGRVKVHLAVNTGMNRIGFCDLNEFCKTLVYIKRNLHKIEIDGIFTHLYNSKNYADSNEQICIFNQYITLLAKYFDIGNITKHAVSSLGAVMYPEFRFDMVRLGILLYGDLDKKAKLDLKQVVEINSKIIATNTVCPKDNIGYGKNIAGKSIKKVATIPLGYADGILRSNSNKGVVLIKNKLCKIVGNVCMDMMMVDVTGIDAKIGDKVVVLGDLPNTSQVAKLCGTIGYEILTNIKQNRFDVRVV